MTCKNTFIPTLPTTKCVEQVHLEFVKEGELEIMMVFLTKESYEITRSDWLVTGHFFPIWTSLFWPIKKQIC
jgi:hypothetical protein